MYVLIVRNNSNPQAIDASLMLVSYFSSQSIEFDLFDVSELDDVTTCEKVASHKTDMNLAVVLGGDGTILHTAWLLSTYNVPILGINFGHLGFLANECEDNVVEMVSRALAGELYSEKRTNLCIDVVCTGEVDPFDNEDIGGNGDNEVVDNQENGQENGQEGAQEDEHPVMSSSCDAASGISQTVSQEDFPNGVIGGGLYGRRSFFALNEIVVTRGAMGRIIDFSLDIADHHIADMRGDGMVIATATGSTAYALSAGGPLVAPSFTGLITVPLSPHTLHTRAILTGENDVVCVTVTTSDTTREATLFVDGDMLMFEKPVKRVYVRRGSDPTLLLRSQSGEFYRYAAQTFFES